MDPIHVANDTQQILSLGYMIAYAPEVDYRFATALHPSAAKLDPTCDETGYRHQIPGPGLVDKIEEVCLYFSYPFCQLVHLLYFDAHGL